MRNSTKALLLAFSLMATLPLFLLAQFDEPDIEPVVKPPAKVAGKPATKAGAKPAVKTAGKGKTQKDAGKTGSGTDDSGGTANVAADFLFDHKLYGSKKLPGYCNCYVVLRNEQKARPLYITGVGKEGVISLRYDNEGGMKDDAALSLQGKGSCLFNGYNVSAATDGPTFAGFDWFSVDPAPDLVVEVGEIRDLRILNPAAIPVLFNPKRDSRIDPAPVQCEATVDVTVSVRGKSTQCKNVAAKLQVNEGRGHWAFWFRSTLGFNGADLGLTGDDAGAVTLKIVMAGFSPLPEGFELSSGTVDARTLDKKGGLLEAEMGF